MLKNINRYDSVDEEPNIILSTVDAYGNKYYTIVYDPTCKNIDIDGLCNILQGNVDN